MAPAIRPDGSDVPRSHSEPHRPEEEEGAVCLLPQIGTTRMMAMNRATGRHGVGVCCATRWWLGVIVVRVKHMLGIDRQLLEALRTPGRLTFWIPTLLFLVAILAGILFVLAIRPLPFSSAAWKHQDYVRSRMVRDLLARDEIIGASREEIDHLLGFPKGRDSLRDDRYIYWVSTATIDDTWLEVQFHDDRVTEIRYTVD